MDVTVVEHIVSSGRRLFSARSFVPLLLLPAIWLALPESLRLEQQLSRAANLVVQWVALCIALAGVLLRCLTVATAPDGTSSRDTRGLRAPSLNTAGMYSAMRHPLYVGNGLMWIGVAASTRVWWLVVIVAFAYAMYIERVMAFEESFLEQSFGDQFTAWAARTPAFFPRWSLWQPATGKILWRRVASEHNGLLAVSVIVTVIHLGSLLQGFAFEDWLALHKDLLTLLAVSGVISTIAIIARRWPTGNHAAGSGEINEGAGGRHG